MLPNTHRWCVREIRGDVCARTTVPPGLDYPQTKEGDKKNKKTKKNGIGTSIFSLHVDACNNSVGGDSVFTKRSSEKKFRAPRFRHLRPFSHGLT